MGSHGEDHKEDMIYATNNKIDGRALAIVLSRSLTQLAHIYIYIYNISKCSSNILCEYIYIYIIDRKYKPGKV